MRKHQRRGRWWIKVLKQGLRQNVAQMLTGFSQKRRVLSWNMKWWKFEKVKDIHVIAGANDDAHRSFLTSQKQHGKTQSWSNENNIYLWFHAGPCHGSWWMSRMAGISSEELLTGRRYVEPRRHSGTLDFSSASDWSVHRRTDEDSPEWSQLPRWHFITPPPHFPQTASFSINCVRFLQARFISTSFFLPPSYQTHIKPFTLLSCLPLCPQTHFSSFCILLRCKWGGGERVIVSFTLPKPYRAFYHVIQ